MTVADPSSPNGDDSAATTPTTIAMPARGDWSALMEDIRLRVLSQKSADLEALFTDGLLPTLTKHASTSPPPLDRMPELIDALLLTIPRYHSSHPRNLVLSTLRALIASFRGRGAEEETFCRGLVKMVVNGFASKIKSLETVDRLTRFTLVRWLLVMAEELPKSMNESLFNDLVAMLGSLIDSLYADDQVSVSLRRSCRRAVLRLPAESCRRVIDSCFSLGDNGDRALVLLGMLAGHLGEYRHADLADFFYRQVISQRSPAPVHCIDAWLTLCQQLSPELFATHVATNVDKFLLRSPEVVIPVMARLCADLAHDLSAYLTSWMESSVSELANSSNVTVRNGSATLLTALVQHSKSQEAIFALFEMLKKVFVDRSVATEARLLVLDVFSAMSALPAVSTFLVDSLLKETNETLLARTLQTLSHQASAWSVPKESRVKVLVHLLSSANESTRVITLTELPSLLPEDDDDASLMQVCLRTIEKVDASPLTSSALEGYLAVAALCHLSSKHVPVLAKQLLTTGFLLNDKRITKVSSPSEAQAFAGAVKSLVVLMLRHAAFDQLVPAVWLGIAEGLIAVYAAVADRHARRAIVETCRALLTAPQHHDDEFGLAFVLALENRLCRIDQPSTGNLWQPLARLAVVFPSSWTESTAHAERIDRRLVSFVLVASHPLVALQPVYCSWPNLISSHLGIAPAPLVVRSLHALLDLIFSERGWRSNGAATRHQAAYSACSSVAFISPDIAIPAIMDRLQSELLQDIPYSTLTLLDNIKIWKTEPGELCFDVQFDSASAASGDKWEQQLRAELQAKRLKDRKLTREQQQQVNEALVREAGIRAAVDGACRRLAAFVDFTRPMVATSVGFTKHLPRLLLTIDSIMKHLAQVPDESVELGFTAPNQLFELLVDAAKCLPEEFARLAVPTIAAWFRHSHYPGAPAHYLHESLEEQSSRAVNGLLSLKDVVTGPRANHVDTPAVFMYFFPLLEHRVKRRENSEEDVDHLVSVLDAFASVGASPSLPRPRIMSIIQHIIAAHPKFARKSQLILVRFASAVGEGATDAELITLLDGLMSDAVVVRQACLQSLEYMDVTENVAATFATRVWIVSHDENEEVRALAKDLWATNEMQIGPGYRKFLVSLLVHQQDHVRRSCARSIAHAMQLHGDTRSETFHTIFAEYVEQIKPPPPMRDALGVIISERVTTKEDRWWPRQALGYALEQCAEYLSQSDLIDLLTFMMDAPGSLGDENNQVRRQMLAAAKRAVELHGKAHLFAVLQKLNAFLDQGVSASERHDLIAESVIVLLGVTAQHFDPADSQVQVVIDKLLGALSTPSEAVQLAVAECLAPLIKMSKQRASELVASLFTEATNGATYAVRRGAAYGLAGVIKGYGLALIKESQLPDQLKQAIDDKKFMERRQGAIFIVEALSLILGRLFEPYVLQILPLLLTSFGDGSLEVRQATTDAARCVMRGLSSHCVKMVLPVVLAGLEDMRWRTKAGSVEMLGAMAYLAPKQLALSLPKIVPKLIGVLSDSHPNVQRAANAALDNFNGIITNPEIKRLAPTLMKALADPTKFTHPALAVLVKTQFAHFIDAPSLTLIMPIVDRGLKERSTETKRLAAHILGSMCTLVETKDLVPYLPNSVPLMKEVLIDPVPEARAVCAKAFGSLVERLGEVHFPALIADLFVLLKSENSRVDRQGSAQGLAEIFAALGEDKLNALMPELVANVSSPKPWVREGFTVLLTFVASTFGARFEQHLGIVSPRILRGIADEVEYVREASLQACQMVVTKFSVRAVELMLPELESGMFDENWRIRQSSIQLIGELLYEISGINKRLKADDGTPTDTLEVRRTLMQVLGTERYERVLALLYIARFDTSGQVRQSSIYVWKAIIHNTPKTLKEILSSLMQEIINGLASREHEKRQACATALGDLVVKMGEHVIGETAPILRQSLLSDDPDSRQGACLGLAEILASGGKEQLLEHLDEFMGAILSSLVHPSPDVRDAAVHAVDSLYDHVGQRVTEEILPKLLAEMSGAGVHSLDALEGILKMRPDLFAVLLPTLLATPMTTVHSRALNSLISIINGQVIARKLTSILASLSDGLVNGEDPQAVRDTLKTLSVKLEQSQAVDRLMMLLTEQLRPKNETAVRANACTMLQIYFESAVVADLPFYTPDWIKTLVGLLDSRVDGGSPSLVKSAWSALNAMIAKIAADDLKKYIDPTRQALLSLVDELKSRVDDAEDEEIMIEAFSLPKGMSCVLPVFQHGLLYGGSEHRLMSAQALGDLFMHTPSTMVAPFVLALSGSLIRVISDKVQPAIKEAILEDMRVLITRNANEMKRFAPQLQRTFLKSLSDASSQVRDKASSVFGVFLNIVPSVDPIVKDFDKGIRENDVSVRKALLACLWQILDAGKLSAQSPSTKLVEALLTSKSLWKASAEDVRSCGAMCMAVLAGRVLDKQSAAALVKRVFDERNESPEAQVGALVFLDAYLSDAAVDHTELVCMFAAFILESINSRKADLVDWGLRCASRVLSSPQDVQSVPQEVVASLKSGLLSQLTSDMADARRLALVGLTYASTRTAVTTDLSPSTIADIFSCVRDRVIPVKLAAEKCMIAVLELAKGEHKLHEYAAGVSEAEAKPLMDYHRRVLVKLLVASNQNQGDDGLKDDAAEEFGIFKRATPFG